MGKPELSIIRTVALRLSGQVTVGPSGDEAQSYLLTSSLIAMVDSLAVAV
jgi:hypothetical protein